MMWIRLTTNMNQKLTTVLLAAFVLAAIPFCQIVLVDDSYTSAPPVKEQKENDDHSNAYFHHTMLLSGESVHERIKNTNSSQYTWVGNHWVAPTGVPTFTPRQLKAYYSQRNVLVIGDCTSRRMYTHLRFIMNAINLDDMKLREIEPDPFKVDVKVCSEDMGYRYISHMPGRKWGIVCHNNTLESEDGNVDGKVTKYFKFDHIFRTCFHSLEWFWRSDESFLTEFVQNYDLIIIGMGIWEVCRPDDCRRNKHQNETSNMSAEESLQKAFENMENNNPDGLQVVYRTSGFDATVDNQLIRSTNTLSYQFFYDLDQKSELGRYQKNLTLADWGGVMEARSFGEDRIEGYFHAHYGIEARHLAVQKVTHELVKSELIARNFQTNEH